MLYIILNFVLYRVLYLVGDIIQSFVFYYIDKDGGYRFERSGQDVYSGYYRGGYYKLMQRFVKVLVIVIMDIYNIFILIYNYKYCDQ